MEPPLNFKFIHAADLHLDSPLRGLAEKSEVLAERIQNASRRAFEELVSLAIQESCALLLVAGDVFDGDWKDYRTGLYFATQMARLRDAGVAVVLIQGNHDAENKFVSRLGFAENVHLLSQKSPQTVLFKEAGVAVHGQSFAAREVTDNLAASYPSAIQGMFNIGLLHTALEGHEGDHAHYAPCTVEQLRNHGYDYWALGHVHDFMLLHDTNSPSDPHIVYSGVLQGRNIRETGPKGAVLVSVEDGAIRSAEFVELSPIRWSNCTVDASGLNTEEEILQAVSRGLQALYHQADGKACAVRLVITGRTEARSQLLTSRAEFRERIETVAAGISGDNDVWIEKVSLHLADLHPPIEAQVDDPSIAGRLATLVNEYEQSDEFEVEMKHIAAEIGEKFPSGAAEDGYIQKILGEVRLSARDLALAVIEQGQGGIAGNEEAE